MLLFQLWICVIREENIILQIGNSKKKYYVEGCLDNENNFQKEIITGFFIEMSRILHFLKIYYFLIMQIVAK